MPIRLAIVDDYDVIVNGVAHMFKGYPERIAVVELAANEPVTVDVDIALFDTFAQGEADSADLDVVLTNPLASKVAVYTWALDPALIEAALAKGACGYLSKTLSADELVDALERIHAGEVVVRPQPIESPRTGLDWPGRDDGLSEREAEMIALITQGRTNAEIAAISHLSLNSVKTYIRNAYAKLGVSSRSQAVLWGVAHGLHLEHRRLDSWRISASD
jgi:DNA-binding NarL/FixJ family response regulator